MLCRAIVVLWLLLAAASSAFGQDSDSETAEARQRRNEQLQRTYEEMQLAFADRPDRVLAHMDKPLLAYTNPVRNSNVDGGGATFIWLDGKRPMAAAMLSVRGDASTWVELTSISETALECQFEDGLLWSPTSGNVAGQELKKGPKPAPTDRLRLVQFRSVARRFRVIQRDNEASEDNEMRLLSQPIYRWQDIEAGVIDGALFAFCETTDPETMVMLEIVQPEGVATPFWRYSIARATSRPLKFYLDDELVSELDGYWRGPRSKMDPYMERKLHDAE